MEASAKLPNAAPMKYFDRSLWGQPEWKNKKISRDSQEGISCLRRSLNGRTTKVVGTLKMGFLLSEAEKEKN